MKLLFEPFCEFNSSILSLIEADLYATSFSERVLVSLLLFAVMDVLFKSTYELSFAGFE